VYNIDFVNDKTSFWFLYCYRLMLLHNYFSFALDQSGDFESIGGMMIIVQHIDNAGLACGLSVVLKKKGGDFSEVEVEGCGWLSFQ
jgi:hypothetical protein